MSIVKMKDPDEVVDFTVDWDDENVLASGETITTSTWSVSPSGELTIDSDTNTDTDATATVSAGVIGKVYRLTNEIVTNQSRTMNQSVIVRMEAQ